jgi:hypothetical protein
VTRRHGSAAEAVAVVVYALVDWLVIMAPVLAIELSADRGGIGGTEGLDLLGASAVIATVHAGLAARRLRFEERTAERRADIWIASLDALVILALSTTLLVVAVLAWFPDEHAALASRGFPVVLLWVGLQLAGVVLAELTGRLVFRWLEPRAPHQPTVAEDVAHAIDLVTHHDGDHPPHHDGVDPAHRDGADPQHAGRDPGPGSGGDAAPSRTRHGSPPR